MATAWYSQHACHIALKDVHTRTSSDRVRSWRASIFRDLHNHLWITSSLSMVARCLKAFFQVEVNLVNGVKMGFMQFFTPAQFSVLCARSLLVGTCHGDRWRGGFVSVVMKMIVTENWTEMQKHIKLKQLTFFCILEPSCSYILLSLQATRRLHTILDMTNISSHTADGYIRNMSFLSKIKEKR